MEQSRRGCVGEGSVSWVTGQRRVSGWGQCGLRCSWGGWLHTLRAAEPPEGRERRKQGGQPDECVRWASANLALQRDPGTDTDPEEQQRRPRHWPAATPGNGRVEAIRLGVSTYTGRPETG